MDGKRMEHPKSPFFAKYKTITYKVVRSESVKSTAIILYAANTITRSGTASSHHPLTHALHVRLQLAITCIKELLTDSYRV